MAAETTFIVMSESDQEALKGILTRNDLEMVLAVAEDHYNKNICEPDQKLKCSHITDEDARPETAFQFGKFSVLACDQCRAVHAEGVMRGILQTAATQLLNKSAG